MPSRGRLGNRHVTWRVDMAFDPELAERLRAVLATWVNTALTFVAALPAK